MKNKIKLIFTIIGGIALWLASLYVLVIILWIALMLIDPKEVPQEVSLLPFEEIHGNNIANTKQQGKIGFNQEYVFVATSKGIEKINKETFKTESIAEDAGDSINLVGDRLYYMYKSKIYEINLNSGKKSMILSNWNSVDEIDVIGDKIFGSKGLSGGYLAYITQNNEIYRLESDSSASILIGYYDKNYYYFDSLNEGKNYVCKYNLETHETQGIIHIEDPLSSCFLDSNLIYYSYQKQGLDDKEKLNSVWNYNIETGKTEKIAGFDKSYQVLNVIDNKLILIDEWYSEYEAWYIYDLDSKEMITIKDNHRCNAVYVADNYIIAYYVSEEGNIFKFFNDKGEYLDFEIAY